MPEVCKESQLPQLFISPHIPRFDVCTATIVIRRNVSHAFVNDRFNLCWCGRLSRYQTQRQTQRKRNENAAYHKPKILASTERSRRFYRLISSLLVSFENSPSIPCWMRWRLISSFFSFSIEISWLIPSARSLFADSQSLLLLKVTPGYVVCKSCMRRPSFWTL